MADRLDTPLETRRRFIRRPQLDEDASGKISESIARFLGTPRFIIYLTMFCLRLDRVEHRLGARRDRGSTTPRTGSRR